MSVFLDRLCCRLRVFVRVVLDWRRVCEIRYHVLPWSLSFLQKVEDLGSALWLKHKSARFFFRWVISNLAQKFSFVTNRFDSHERLLCDHWAITDDAVIRISIGLLAGLRSVSPPAALKANVSAIRQIMDQAGRRDYTVKVYSNGSHNLMEVPPENLKEFVRLKRFPPGFFEMMVD